MTQSSTPIRIFISGACAGLAEVRDSLASHADVELVGTASEPSKAGPKLASSGAQVVLHALQRPESIPEEEIARIREHTAAPIILLVTRLAQTLFDEAVQHGLNDVVLLPQLTDNLVFAVKKAHSLGHIRSGESAPRRSSSEGRIITLFSPKGGTGKSSLTANMGAAYAKQLKRRTLLIDLDLQFGDLAIILGSDPKQTILDLVMSHGDLDADKLSGFITQHESGLHLLPAPLRPEDSELINEERLASLLQVAKSSYDIVLIDTPPNFNSSVLTALDRTDELLVVASLDVPAVKSVKVCMQTLHMLNYPLARAHLVLNRSGTRVGLKHRDVEKAIGKPIRFEIPSSRSMPVSINRGVPIVISEPRGDVSRAILKTCASLMPDGEKELAKLDRNTNRVSSSKERPSDPERVPWKERHAAKKAARAAQLQMDANPDVDISVDEAA